MGLSQFDVPTFEKYRIVKEEPTTPDKAPEESKQDFKRLIQKVEQM